MSSVEPLPTRIFWAEAPAYSPIRVGGNDIDMADQGLAHFGRDAQGVHVGAEAGDVLLFDSVDFFYFFQVAAVEMVFML